MKMPERFRRTPRKETGILNREQVGAVVDKLLDDLRQGFITENYNGDIEEESTLHEQCYSVVLKGRGKYYVVNVWRKFGEFADSDRLIHIGEYGSLKEMKDWNKIQRFVNLEEVVK